MTNTQELFKTPFYSYHVDQGAKMVDFAGWDMPLHYGSIIEEHLQVRSSGGLFDVSHMGRLRFKGRDACKLLDRLCTRQIKGMSVGQIRYSLICNKTGGCLDDVLVYCEGDANYMMVCNGSNRTKIWNHIEENQGAFVCKVKDETEATAMIAIQGPKVMGLLSSVSSEIPNLKRYRFIKKNLFITSIMVSRTGYTGEDGVEVILPKGFANKAIEMMFKHVEDTESIKPCGLGSRDSLRLETGMPLYGHELDEETDPLSAGLSFACKLDKGIGANDSEPFIGQDALQHIAEQGSGKRLVGLQLEGKRSPRQGMTVSASGKNIGRVTSGCFSPTCNHPIAMAYIANDFSGSSVEVDFGKHQLPATVVSLPFYKN